MSSEEADVLKEFISKSMTSVKTVTQMSCTANRLMRCEKKRTKIKGIKARREGV